MMQPSEIAALIDYSQLKPTVTRRDIRRMCAQARRYGFHAVCVNSYWVRECVRLLAGSGVKVAATVGYPLGAASTRAKVAEAEQAFRDGADEIDVVMNIGEMLSGNEREVLRDLKEVVAVARRRRKCAKAIIETAYLNKRQKIAACRIALRAGADFVKTSTGYAPMGATVEDVKLIRRVVGRRAGVKAAGGIRSLRQLLALVAAGANRIGATAGPEIVEEAKKLHSTTK
ncbi:MAG: deoxyribose-phosphate aldolase [Candidatus Micrarchaeia archaeon]